MRYESDMTTNNSVRLERRTRHRVAQATTLCGDTPSAPLNSEYTTPPPGGGCQTYRQEN